MIIKKMLQNIKWRSVALPLVASIIFAMAGVYLFTDLPDKIQSFFKNKDNAIAVLAQKANTVKVKEENQLGWQDAGKNVALKNNQQIFTGPESFAQIRFNSGAVLNLNEKSLIRIDQKRDKTQIDLSSGLFNMNIKKNETIPKADYEIKMGEKILSVSSEKNFDVQVSAEKGKEKILVKDGALIIKSKGKTVTATKNDEIRVDSHGELKVRLAPFTLLSPKDKAQIFARKSDAVEFSWNQNNPSIPAVSLQISSTPEFTRARNYVISGTHAAFQDIASGHYYWRLSSTDQKNQSDVFDFRFSSLDAPEIKKPLEQEFIDSQDFADLEWRATDGGQQYQIQIVRDIEDNVPQEILSKEKTYKFNPPEDGAYKWRVRSFYTAQTQGDWTEWHHFDYVKNPKLELQYPANGESVVLFSIEQGILNFRWNWPREEIFKITIAKDELLNSPVLLSKEVPNKKADEEPVGDNLSKKFNLNFNWPFKELEKIGTFYWKVCTEKICSVVSNFNIILPPIQDASPSQDKTMELWKENAPVELTWTDCSKILAPYKVGYELQISDDANFQNILADKKDITKNVFLWNNPKLGEFFWRVRFGTHVKPDEELKSDWSPVFKFNLGKTKALPPLIKTPKKLNFKIRKKQQQRAPSSIESKKSGITTERIDEDIIYKIELDDGIDPKKVKSYIVEVYKDSGFSEKIFSTTSATNEFRWDAPRPGDFYMRIALMDYWNQTGKFSQPIQVHIEKIPIPMATFNLQIPLGGTGITYQEGENKQVHFSWDKLSDIKEYILKIKNKNSSNAPGQDTVFQKTANRNELVLSTKELNLDGEYYWQITAIPSTDDYYNGVSKLRLIRFKKIPRHKLKSSNNTNNPSKNIYSAALRAMNYKYNSKYKSNIGEFKSVMGFGAVLGFDNFRLAGRYARYPFRFSTLISVDRPNADGNVSVEYSIYEKVFPEKIEGTRISPYFIFGYEQWNYCIISDHFLFETYQLRALSAGVGTLWRPSMTKPLSLSLDYMIPVKVTSNYGQQSFQNGGYILNMGIKYQFKANFFSAFHYSLLRIDQEKFYGTKLYLDAGKSF